MEELIYKFHKYRKPIIYRVDGTWYIFNGFNKLPEIYLIAWATWKHKAEYSKRGNHDSNNNSRRKPLPAY